MYAVAIIADLFSLIPFVNWISSFMAATIFKVFEDVMEVKLFSPENTHGSMVTFLVEFIPGIAMLPTWTIRVWIAKEMHRHAMRKAGMETHPNLRLPKFK